MPSKNTADYNEWKKKQKMKDFVAWSPPPPKKKK